MSSPTHLTPSDVDEEYAFPSANTLNYTSTLPNYFPATPGNILSDFLENSKNDEIPHVFSPFYNNPYLKDMQAIYTKESPIPPPNPITPPRNVGYPRALLHRSIAQDIRTTTTLMSSPTHLTPSDVDEEYAFPSANTLNYTSTLPNYFPATPGNILSDFLENSKNDEIPHVFSPFYNNPYLKDMQAIYTKESPIPPPNPITPPVILTPSPLLPSSLLFDP
nr:hypothetical protein [Tanacetum cinerariifolium]